MSLTPLKECEVSGRIHSFVAKAKNLLSIDEKTFSEVLDTHQKNVADYLDGKKILSAKQLFSISSFFNTPIERILDGTVDFEVLRKQFVTKEYKLPDEYLIGANGRQRTVINIFNYVLRHFGERELEVILKQFQLSLDYFNDPEELINNKFLVELLDKLQAIGYAEHDFRNMGEESYEVNKTSFLAGLMSTAVSKKELIENVFTDYIKYYDSNFHYKIQKLTDTEAIVNFHQDKDVAEALKTKKLGSMNANIMKLGVLKSLPRYIDETDFDVTIPKSIHLGDSHCAFHISYQNKPHI